MAFEIVTIIMPSFTEDVSGFNTMRTNTCLAANAKGNASF